MKWKIDSQIQQNNILELNLKSEDNRLVKIVYNIKTDEAETTAIMGKFSLEEKRQMFLQHRDIFLNEREKYLRNN